MQEIDLPQLAHLVHGDWNAALEAEGFRGIELDTSKDEPPCPACGTAAPLVEGACGDCGLQLDR